MAFDPGVFPTPGAIAVFYHRAQAESGGSSLTNGTGQRILIEQISHLGFFDQTRRSAITTVFTAMEMAPNF
jgi:hypothetical protein